MEVLLYPDTNLGKIKHIENTLMVNIIKAISYHVVIEPVTEEDDYIIDVNCTEVIVEPSEQEGDVRVVDDSGPSDGCVEVYLRNVGNSLR